MGRKVDPNSRTSRIAALLAEGPAKTSEIAAEMNIDLRLASAHLFKLLRRRLVSSDRRPNGSTVWRLLLPSADAEPSIDETPVCIANEHPILIAIAVRTRIRKAYDGKRCAVMRLGDYVHVYPLGHSELRRIASQNFGAAIGAYDGDADCESIAKDIESKCGSYVAKHAA